MSMNVVRFGISIPPKLLEKFDEIIKEKGYTNRSEAIRDLIRDLIVKEELKKSEKEGIGVLSIVYEHHKSHVLEKIIEAQHENEKNIVSTLHIHLDKENCMEVIIIRGKIMDVKKIADKIISIKGVKHGKLIMSTATESLA